MRMKMLVCTGVLAIGSVVSPCISVGGVTIYGINNLDPDGFGSDTLVVFDSDDPEGWTVVGPTGVDPGFFSGLAFRGIGGGLFGYVQCPGLGAHGLYSINIKTGLASQVGDLAETPISDIAYNPVDGAIYGVYVDGTIHTIDTDTGATNFVASLGGNYADFPIGLGIDSYGVFCVHGLVDDAISKGPIQNQQLLYKTELDTNFSQGLAIDWSRDNQGFHAAYGPFGSGRYSRLYEFAPDGSGLVLNGRFFPDGASPIFEAGDISVLPASTCFWDLDGDGSIGVSDLLVLLANWGPCP